MRDGVSPPDLPVPLTCIVRPHLGLLELGAARRWMVAPGADGPRATGPGGVWQQDIDLD